MFEFFREKAHRLSRDCYRGRVTASFTACIDDFKRPFEDASFVAEFLSKLTKAVQKNDCTVFIYCFMPDHLHVMMHGQSDSADLWKAMVDFKQTTGFWFGQNRPEFHWQNDFHDRVIRNVAERSVRIRYIADNPVRRKLVTLWSDYPHTGAIGHDLAAIMADVATE